MQPLGGRKRVWRDSYALAQWGNKNWSFITATFTPGCRLLSSNPEDCGRRRAFLRVGSARMEAGRWVQLRTIKEAFFFAPASLHWTRLPEWNVESEIRLSQCFMLLSWNIGTFGVDWRGRLLQVFYSQKRRKTKHKFPFEFVNINTDVDLNATLEGRCWSFPDILPSFGYFWASKSPSSDSEAEIHGEDFCPGILLIRHLPFIRPQKQWLYLLWKQTVSCFVYPSGFPAAVSHAQSVCECVCICVCVGGMGLQSHVAAWRWEALWVGQKIS